MPTSHRHGGRPTSGPERPLASPRSSRTATLVLVGLLPVLSLLALPRESAAKYGSPVVAHLATAHGRVFLAPSLRGSPAHRTTLHTAHPPVSASQDSHHPIGERVGSHSDLGNGNVLARPTRSSLQIVALQTPGCFSPRFADALRSGCRRSAAFQQVAGQAHRLRAPPSTSL